MNGAARATIALILFAALTAQSMVEEAGGEPRIGPATDRVGLPDNFRTTFEHVRTGPGGKGQQVAVYLNEAAASVKSLDNVPYPYGSVIVAEWRRTDGKGGEATPFRIDVMRRERGYGEAYGEARTGEWEYVRYRTDGSHLVPPGESGWCSSCHQKAGKERDWVFHGRF